MSALCAISLLFLSLIPIPASSAAAGNYEITIDTTNAGNTGEDAKPIPSGTAWTGTINLFNTQAGLEATDQVSIIATVTSGPDDTDITSTCTFTAQSVANFSLAVISASTGELRIDPTGVIARIVNTTLPLFDFSCPTDIGGSYTMTITEGTSVAKNGFTTGTFPTPTANNPDTGRIMVSGISVIQAVERGLNGKSYLGYQVKVRITLPTQTSSNIYSFASTGVGTILSAGAQNGTNSRLSDEVVFLTSQDDSDATSQVLVLTSESAGTQKIKVAIPNEATGIIVDTLFSAEIIWKAAPELSATLSLVRIAPIDTTPGAQGTTEEGSFTEEIDSRAYGANKGSSSGTNRIATIQVLLRKSDGSADLSGHTISAEVEGSGLISVNPRSISEDGDKRTSSYTLDQGIENIAWIHVNTDGTAGPGTIKIFITSAKTLETNLVATRAIYSWSDVAKIEVTKSYFKIGLAGSTTGAATSSRYANGEIGSPFASSSVSIQGNGSQTTTPAFIVRVSDALGQLVNLSSAPEVTSSDTEVATGGACSQDDGQTFYSSGKGYGYYNCFFSIASSAKSGQKATLTIRSLDTANSNDSRTLYISTTYEVSVGGYETNGQVKMTFDKEVYGSGEPMFVTLTATDEAGNPVFDGHPSPEVTFNMAAGGTLGKGFFVNGRRDSSNIYLYAPLVSGIFKAITTTASGRELTAIAEVKGADVKASTAVVEASAKVVAASADAAKALKRAQDAAAKATSAATKARASADKTSDAVEKLTNQFDTNLNSLQAELARLINSIASISTKI